MWKNDAYFECDIAVEERFVEQHEISRLVVIDLPLIPKHQFRILHLLGSDAMWCLAQLYPQLFTNGLGIELALMV